MNWDNLNEQQRQLSESFYGGKAEALFELEEQVMNSAGEQYKQGKDDFAQLLRQLSIEIGKKALDYKKHQKNYAPKFTGGV